VIAIDAGILACAINRFAPEHARAVRVVESLANGDAPWALPWPAAHAFVRRVTHPHAVARPLAPRDAWAFVEVLLGRPSAHALGPGPRHAAAAAEVLALIAEGPPAGLPPGFPLAVTLREHGVRALLTADRSLRVYPFLELRDPLHGPPWSPGEPPARRRRVLAPRSRRRDA
jgi:hypothetical protein